MASLAIENKQILNINDFGQVQSKTDLETLQLPTVDNNVMI